MVVALECATVAALHNADSVLVTVHRTDLGCFCDIGQPGDWCATIPDTDKRPCSIGLA